MVSCAGTRIILVLLFRFKPMRSQATEDFYPIQASIGDWESLWYYGLWFDSVHGELTRLWINQFLLDLIKNSSWSTMDALVLNRGRAHSNWGSIDYRTDEIELN